MTSERVVIVTGAAQNIGAAIAARFQQAGDKVICADLKAPAASPSHHGMSQHFIETNVAEETSVAALMTAVEHDYGRLDVLVNNAGICIETPLESTTVEDWDRVMAINVRGTFLMCKHARPLMTLPTVSSPAIVNISSIEGLGANPLHGVYAASKAAVAALTHNLALEYGRHGIRCNAISPGWINTPFNEQLLAQYPDRELVEQEIKALHPVGRLGTPEDVASTVYWLASAESSFISGQNLIVDGGRLAKLPLPNL
ncbi:MAG: SDR family oxidoreductase [Luminiphilus sp.]|nr:SDR family oxidoreductase [Luminiphilus sp.]